MADSPRTVRLKEGDSAADPPTTSVQSRERSKQSKFHKPIIYSIYTLFFTLFAIFIPFVLKHSVTLYSFIFSFVLFNLLVPIVTHLVNNAEVFKAVPDQKRTEIINRIISIVFNLSVTLHSWDFYLELGFLGLPRFADMLQGPTWLLDFFSGWSIGYILYDFIYLVSVYGETSYAILLHHCGEMLIVSAYIYDPPLGGIYTLSGAVMLISSAFLHIQRISYLTKAPRQYMMIIKSILLIVWIGGRLIVSPRLMWIAYNNIPLGILHYLLIFTGIALFAMNSLWGFKIARKNDLGY